MADFVNGLPGVSSVRTATPRIIFRGGNVEEWLPGGKIIKASVSADPDNTGATRLLRAGVVMGKITASGYYAPSIMGLSNAAYAAGATSLTITSQLSTELARRVGASGTFKIVGPPTASGVVAQETVTYSALGATTATITALVNSYVTGSLVMPTDGSENPISFIDADHGVYVLDSFGTEEDKPWPKVPIMATVITANIVNYPADASTQNWLKGMLSGKGRGKFIFDDEF